MTTYQVTVKISAEANMYIEAENEEEAKLKAKEKGILQELEDNLVEAEPEIKADDTNPF